jgi:hypothetical protein
MARKSNEVLRDASRELGVKAVAADMGLSKSLVYKWCEPKLADLGSGSDNPLDRIQRFYDITKSQEVIQWVCELAKCYPVRNPEVTAQDPPEPVLRITQRILSDFSALLENVSASIEDDGVIDIDEACLIRNRWEELKMAAESFVVACEKGLYSEHHEE